MDKVKIDRINELAKLSKERELTEAETEERKSLRGEYLKEFRDGMKATLDNTYIQYPDGTKDPLKKPKKDQNPL